MVDFDRRWWLTLAVLVWLAGAPAAALAWHIEGTVYCDANQSGFIDDGDTPVGGITVRLTALTATPNAILGANTTAGGFYSRSLPDHPEDYMVAIFSGLPAGSSVIIPSSTAYGTPPVGPIALNDGFKHATNVDFLLSGCLAASPTPTATSTVVSTPIVLASPTATELPTTTPTPEKTATPTPTKLSTVTATPTVAIATATATELPTPTETSTPVASPTATVTEVPTVTATPTIGVASATPAGTETPTPAVTATATITPEASATPTTTASGAPTPTVTATDVATPTPTTTATTTRSATPLSTNTPVATPTATQTLPGTTATPSPGQTPGGFLNTFQCYEIDRATLPAIKDLPVEDRFGPSTIDIGGKGRVKRLCNPATVNAPNQVVPPEPDHLVGYVIGQNTPKLDRVPDVIVSNVFGTIDLTVTRPILFMVPGAKSLSAPPAPITPAIDHFQCYAIASAGKLQVPGLVVTDQFTTQTLDIKRPSRLCVAANKKSEGFIDESAALMCYEVRTASGTSPFRGPDGPVYINNQFGPDVLKVTRPTELCVPSTVTPPLARIGQRKAPPRVRR